MKQLGAFPITLHFGYKLCSIDIDSLIMAICILYVNLSHFDFCSISPTLIEMDPHRIRCALPGLVLYLLLLSISTLGSASPLKDLISGSLSKRAANVLTSKLTQSIVY